MNRKVDPEKRVFDWIREKNLIKSGEKVCVCFSGGADSTALLYILNSLRQQLHIELCACHLHHGIRGAEADRDAEFCERVCASLGIKLFYERINVPELQKSSGKSLEETARDVRYEWFASLGAAQNIDRFATAHQKNDLAETVLYRLIRGTTTDGLQGIPVKRGNVIRPLLVLDREEIEKYLSEKNLSFVHDNSNDDDIYTRNYIRHTVIPDLEKVNPRIVNSLCRLAETASDDRLFFESLLDAEYSEDMSDSLLRRKIGADYFHVSNHTLCAEHTNRLMRLFRLKEAETITLPEMVYARYRDGRLVFEKERDSLPELNDAILRDGETVLYDGMLKITFSDHKIEHESDSAEFIYNLSTEIPLRLDGICGMIRYRSRKAGDKLCRFGVHHDVRKMISEQNIPLSLRPALPCFYDDEGLLFVPFIGVADRVYTKDGENIKWIRVDYYERLTRKESE